MGDKNGTPPIGRGDQNGDKSGIPPDIEDMDYTEEEMLEVVSRYPGMDDEMNVETAKELAWIKKNGYPSIMAHAKVTDPRFLVFLHWIMNQKFEDLEEAAKRLKLTQRTVAKWWRFLKENQYINPEIVEYYESKYGGPPKGKKKAEGERPKPPRSSSICLEETLSRAGGKHKLRGMSEERDRTIEIPERTLKELVAAGYIGDKRKLAQVVNEIITQYKDTEELFKEVLQKGSTGTAGGITVSASNVDEALKKLQDSIINAYIMGETIRTLRAALGPGMYQVNPDGSMTLRFPGDYPADNDRIKQLEERIRELQEAIRKQREEEKWKAIEERINQLAEKLAEKGSAPESKEIEALRDEIRKLREERFKEDLKETIEDLKETLASASQGRQGGYDIIDAITKLDTLLRDREMKIEQLRAEVEKTRDERFMQLLESMQEEIKELRARLREAAKNPLQAYQELAEQISQLEKIMESIRKGSSPKVDQDVKQRALDLLQDVVSKATDVFLSQRSPQTPMDVGARLTSLPCPACGKPIPVPDVQNAKTITCPHCGKEWAVEKQPI